MMHAAARRAKTQPARMLSNETLLRKRAAKSKAIGSQILPRWAGARRALGEIATVPMIPVPLTATSTLIPLVLGFAGRQAAQGRTLPVRTAVL